MRTYLKPVFFIFLLLETACPQAVSFFKELPKKQQQIWLKLLHFSPHEVEGKSLADGKMFFIHPEGNENAQAELIATIEAFNDHSKRFGKGELIAPCAFPARKIFLENNQLIPVETISCPDFERWQQEIDPGSISLVFSDAYPNNPASMFGHTFIRFNKRNKTNDLLDYGASFEAITDPSDNAIVYTFKGIFGGYPGVFDLHPYYKKVNSYSNSEGRNLWEYPIKISNEKVTFLLAHLWELYNTTYFDYFFLDENCSYHLLELIQLASDENFKTPMRWFYLPRDIVIELEEKNLLESPVFRPSLKEQFRGRFEELNQKEKLSFEKAYHEFSLDINTRQMDAMILLLQLDRYRSEGKINQNEQQYFNQLLLKRSKDLSPKTEIKYSPPKTAPHLGHGTEKFQLGSGRQYDQTITQFFYRSGYHFLTESDLGYTPFSEFSFLSGKLLYYHEDKKISYDHINLVSVTSLHPWSFYYSQASWRASVRSEEIMETDIVNDHATEADFHLGLSFGTEKFIASLLGGGMVRHSQTFKRDFQLGPSIDMIIGMQFQNKIKFILDMNYYMDLLGDKDLHRGTINPVFSWQVTRSLEIELLYKQMTRYNRKKFGGSLGYSF